MLKCSLGTDMEWAMGLNRTRRWQRSGIARQQNMLFRCLPERMLQDISWRSFALKVTEFPKTMCRRIFGSDSWDPRRM